MKKLTGKDRLSKYAFGGASGDPLTPAEQKIADEYSKKGYVVAKVNGQLSFKKDPTFKAPNTPANTPATPVPSTTVASNPNAPVKKDRIPLPNYSDKDSRKQYAQAFRNKYGKDTLTGYGDIPLRVNEKPVYGTDTSKNLITKAAQATGVDPALLYSSAMIEGQSGLYVGAAKTDKGEDGWRGYTGDKDFPISGLWGFGLDSFQDYYPTLKKKGYLPKDFDKQFKVWEDEGGPEGSTGGSESTMFKSTDAGIQAKAAMMRAFYDEFDDYAKKKKVNLTPEQRDFFALAHFNSGAHGYEMLDAYNKAGLLKDNKFLEKMPDVNVGFMYKGKPMSKEAAAKLHKQIYGNVSPRLAAAKGLKEEGLFDMGGEAGGDAAGAAASGGGAGWGAAGQLLPVLGDALQAFLTKPSYTNQPIMNAQTAKNMTSPYAFGGELGDIDEDQYALFLQAMFANQLGAEEGDDENYDVPAEEVEGEQETDSDEDDSFAYGGQAKKHKIYIKPSKRGTFTAAANKHGKSVQTFAAQVLANKGNYSPAMVKKANFARNAAKWKHAMGGEAEYASEYAYGGIHINPANKGKFTATKKKTGKTTAQLTHSKNPLTRKRAIFAQNAKKWHHAMGGEANPYEIMAAMGYYAQGGDTPINVEGDEIVETPDGQMQKMQGPSHEEGGIDMQVPQGTKIFSDRLQIEGKSMQQRKASREKRLKAIAKNLERNPHDLISKGSMERAKMVMDQEEEQDMALQKVANKIYAPPQQKKQAAYGDEVGGDPWTSYINSLMPNGGGASQIPYQLGKQPTSRVDDAPPIDEPTSAVDEGFAMPTSAVDEGFAMPDDNTGAGTKGSKYKSAAGLTTGDYIGLGANLFNAIAPIINTRNARRATKPEVNRFQGFGKQALEANAKAQDFAAVSMGNARRDLDTATGTSILRNRLGARGINTMRALDTASDIARNKAIGDIYGNYANQMTGLLGQEGQLANQRDQMVMSGATARDQREAQNIDNYYTNMAQNLTNFGTNIGNIGKSLNVSKGNKDNASLLAQMSEYFDFGRDEQGNLVLKNKGK